MKFRGKTKDGQWVEGYYWRNCVTAEHKITTSIMGNDNFSDFEILPESLSMETGVKDKNGKMIFGSIPLEDGTLSKGGDRCEYIHHVFADMVGDIAWDNLKCGFVFCDNEKGYMFDDIDFSECNIIGNQLK